jgi:two-component system nitrogen regulation response regulator NtrX
MNPYESILGTSAAAQALRNAIAGAARTSQPTAILGGPGSGKTLAAEVLHQARERRGRYVRLYGEELARHSLGPVFFGGPGDPGVLERAAGGTIHFEDAANLPPEDQEFIGRLIDRDEFAVRDIHLILTTRSRPSDLAAGGFRAALYHRLSEVVLMVPPLAERGLDVVELAAVFWNGWPREALTLLPFHPWPGNVRELIELSTVMRHHPSPGADAVATRLGLAPDPRERLWTLLHELKGDVFRTAQRLGVCESTIRRRMTTFGIPRGAGRCG